MHMAFAFDVVETIRREEPELSANPFAFLDLQDVQELANFFERRVSAYQSSVPGTVAFTEDF